MWPGPYGDRGSRKYLLASLDQSLSRMGLDFTEEELAEIDRYATETGINIWAASSK